MRGGGETSKCLYMIFSSAQRVHSSYEALDTGSTNFAANPSPKDKDHLGEEGGKETEAKGRKDSLTSNGISFEPF